MSDIESKRLTAYNMKTKEKNVPMYKAIINKTVANNRATYVAKGTTEDGTMKLSTVTSLSKAEEAINAGVATKGEGWD